MNAHSMSLRLRLFLVILTPLLLVSVMLGIWRFDVAQRTAEDLFDRSLLSAALAISRDVAISEGDALSPKTRELISGAGGGEVFYHVTGPGGIYVTGYAYPPIPETSVEGSALNYFVAEYRNEQVQVLQMAETATIGNLSGPTVVTVWQRLNDREVFAATLARRAVGLMSALMVTLAIVVWFGVQLGLRPLNDLQNAISLRNPDDLGRIQRAVPPEVSGVVETLNRLFGQVENSIQSHQAFISDAAHQLRNPASALLSLAETLPDIEDKDDRKAHEREFIESARHLARLTEQLLSLERLRYDAVSHLEVIDLNHVAQSASANVAPSILAQDISFEFIASSEGLSVHADPMLLKEAVINLCDNALRHGGPNLRSIAVQTARNGVMAIVTVSDDGQGIPFDQQQDAFRRFGQLQTGTGSGLGLAIVEETVRQYNGHVRILPVSVGTSVEISLPLSKA